MSRIDEQKEQEYKKRGSTTSSSSSSGGDLGLFTSSIQSMQMEMIKQMLSMQMDAMQNFANMLQLLTRFNAVFKTTIQSNGRISIPEAERKALGIEEGDLVQVIIIPLEKQRRESGEST
ncbi:MAG: AbrB/MazE/SpoVT family DNA-binding domain-containing protein [Candidatus Nitrosocaldus sp.]|nr:AbrB/MazE/SpoVT family DNA-binding domain-containing protein [Candidatus Nitrosocaldus sp.]MDW8000266.1 AbrB/MazE/SpoVT family DNA-binding domain-containing protein [Candidatus Nitrosocaldus sp.]